MLILYKDYIYDNSYSYTKSHSTRQGQKQYFDSMIYKVIEEVNYIKDYESFIIEEEYETLLLEGVNYISFINEDKEIYAFITRKEYVNEFSTRLYYEIDVLQTFYFDVEIDNPFLKRSNTFNEYNLDEGLDTGEYYIADEQTIFNKEYIYFAMFNGIKEQQVITNTSGEVIDVKELNSNTSNPITLIDNIPYPLFFMTLKETYEEPTEIIVGVNSNGTTNAQLSEIVTSARKLIGKNYEWGKNYGELGDIYGNKSTTGTDCSGLVQWAYYDSAMMERVGLSGRWTTYTMIEHGTSIPLSSARPGDVIFTNFSEPGVPEHVVLVVSVSGNNVTIIEAQQPGVAILERTMTYDENTMDLRRLL